MDLQQKNKYLDQAQYLDCDELTQSIISELDFVQHRFEVQDDFPEIIHYEFTAKDSIEKVQTIGSKSFQYIMYDGRKLQINFVDGEWISDDGIKLDSIQVHINVQSLDDIRERSQRRTAIDIKEGSKQRTTLDKIIAQADAYAFLRIQHTVEKSIAAFYIHHNSSRYQYYKTSLDITGVSEKVYDIVADKNNKWALSLVR